MPVETTPLGFKKPDGSDPVRNGENHIATNAQRSQDLLAEARAQINELMDRTTSHIDGGTPGAIYTPEQTIDGGTV